MAALVLIIIAFLLVFASTLIVTHLYQRMHTESRGQLFWLTSAAFVFGIGVWSMHFVALLAHRFPVKVMYHIGYVFLSMAAMILITFVALCLFRFAAYSRRLFWYVIAGFVQTAAILVMHFIGMRAIRAEASQHYQSSFSLLSILVTAAMFVFVFYQMRYFREYWHRQLLCALLISSSIEFLHYGNMPIMHSLSLTHHSARLEPTQNQFFLAISISAVVAIIFLYSIVVILIDNRLKQSEDQLRRMNITYSLILDSVAEGIFRLDDQSRIVFWNVAAEQLTGYKATEVLGTPIRKRFAQEANTVSPIEEAIRKGEDTYVAEELFLKKDGAAFPVEYHITPMYEKGRTAGAVINFTDISQRKKNELFILESEKLSLAGQLAAGIAHEIRNPLTAIKGFMKLFQNGVNKAEYIAIISSEISRMESIINELLLLAKPQVNRRQSVDLCQLLNDVHTLLESQAILSSVRMELQFGDEPLYIECDGGEIKQVFINLIKNAIEASNKGGEIVISSKRRDHHIVTTIIDNGSGIPKELLDQIGRPFFSTKVRGTGLGLMISNKIIASHGGSIHIDSSEGEGTTFQVVLPGGKPIGT
ncbi:ATP-binding protein [Paenibacillus albus]|uniref:histidine kinase n=1 Tax=Paenibacillus albus TaxID=2495582 RepID=A0A3Q8X830_9BACL|nr:ATP-binding protein [Paenibacillus albus]AZN42694.1 PAS domain S-box protein [Paenibacillus albus]